MRWYRHALRLARVSVFLAVAALIACNVVFFFLLRHPTEAGRRLLDHIEGFKMFLSEVDGDRMSRMGAPDRTPELFEKFFPYAIAFDLQDKWAQQFSQVLSAAAGGVGSTSVTGYTPLWYSGDDLSSFSPQTFSDSFGSSFSSAVSSSSSPPGSDSGSGGGGDSGGGGGGGGGGGW